MATGLNFHYTKGDSFLHRSDVRIKLAGMIIFSLLMLNISLYRLLAMGAILILLTRAGRAKNRAQVEGISLFMLIMPLVIFVGNFLSLYASTGWQSALLTASMRMGAFICILRLALLFSATTDPLILTPAIYRVLKPIPFIPAARISSSMGLSLSLIPIILDEMAEIRDAMASRCGWNPRRPIRNLIYLGMPLLEGVLSKAEALSDAMQSRLYREDPTEPADIENSMKIEPLILLLGLTLILTLPDMLLS